MSAPSFARRRRTLPWEFLLRELRIGRRPNIDFSDARRREEWRARSFGLSRQTRPDPLSRLNQEVARFEKEEFRLEQVTALRQVGYLLRLVERELPALDRRRAEKAKQLVGTARELPDIEELRRRPIPPPWQTSGRRP